MITLRIMKPEGVREFKKYLNDILMQGITRVKPNLNNDYYSEEFKPTIYLETEINFSTKYELVKYLDEVFEASNVYREEIIDNPGIWTWLAYAYFDQISNNKTKIYSMVERYVCSSVTDYFQYKKHLIAPYFNYYSKYKNNDIPIWKIFLYGKVYEINQFVDKIAGNQYIISSNKLLEAVYKLYFDDHNNKHKKGFLTEKNQGNLLRFIKVVNQLSLNYDLYSMESDEIISLLPKEFEKWI